jgi:hypothetical protein
MPLQLGLELTVLGMVLGNVVLELMDVYKLCRAEGSISLGIRTHFLSFWNYMDMFNMALQLMAALVWFNYQQMRRQDLFPKLRYDVYDNAASPQAGAHTRSRVRLT